MKTCAKCAQIKDFLEFGRCARHGYQSWCKSCKAADHAGNREARKKLMREHYAANKSAYNQGAVDWAVNNRERSNAIKRKSAKKNPGATRANCAKREAEKLNRTPKWLTAHQKRLIRMFYEASAALTRELGIKFEVDHIIPLQGENVSGLHVPWNLQVLTRAENRRKRNKVT